MAFFYQIHAERIYGSAFPSTGDPRNSYTDSVSGIRQALFDNGLSHCLMFRLGTFHQRYCLAQHRDVTRQNPFCKLLHRIFFPLLFFAKMQIGIYAWWLNYTLVDV
jgi:hypothetical protein